MPAPFHSRLARPGERAGGRQLDDGGDAELAHGGQARVEAHRAGDLADQTGQRLGAGVDGRAVGVGEQPPARVGGTQAADQALELLAGRAPCSRCGRRRRPTAARSAPSPAGRPSARRGRRATPAATICPAPFMLAGVRPCLSIAARTSSGSPPRTADMPVGVCAQARGHRPAADGGERDRRLDRQHPGQRGGGELADAVPGDDDVASAAGALTGPGSAPSSRATNRLIATTQRLGDRGVLDRLGVTGGAEGQEVGVGDGAGPAEEGFGSGEVEPVGEHSGFLRTLSGGEDGQHPLTVPVIFVARGRRAARKDTADLCREPTKSGGPWRPG